jgi:hypothetical protein
MSLAHGAIADILRRRVSEVTPKYHQFYTTTLRDTSALWVLRLYNRMSSNRQKRRDG